MTSANKDKVQGLTQAFKSALAAVSNVDVKIEATYGHGDKVEPIPDVLAIFDEQKVDGKSRITWKHTPGTVALIDFWGSYCVHCHEPMQNN